MSSRRPRWRLVAFSSVPLVAMVVVLSWLSLHHTKSATTTTTTTTTSVSSPSNGALTAPSTTLAQDTKFFTDVTDADAGLATYEKTYSELALRAMLTDGSAFCAFLHRDRSIDPALVSVVVGARGVESSTHLPLTIATFNALDAVSLLTLCPSEQSLVPRADLVKIEELGATLATG